MNIILYGLTSSFGRSLEQRSHVYVETTIGITGCYYFGATVVTILAHLGHHDTGLTSLFLRKLLGQLASTLEVAIILTFC